MKRCVFIVIMALFIAGCANSQTAEKPQEARPHHHGSFEEVAYMHGLPLYYETTFADLEPRAETIVRGRMGDDARIIFQYSELRPNMRITGNNIVSFEVLEVIRGSIGVGDTIKIAEPYYIIDGVLLTHSNYMPSTPHQEYFFFLLNPLTENVPEGYEGAFWVVHGERSRFPVPAADMARDGAFAAYAQAFSAADLGLGTYANIELYMSLWQEVIDAYMN